MRLGLLFLMVADELSLDDSSNDLWVLILEIWLMVILANQRHCYTTSRNATAGFTGWSAVHVKIKSSSWSKLFPIHSFVGDADRSQGAT